MSYDRPSTSAWNPGGQSIDQDKIVFAFEREYFQNFGQAPQPPPPLLAQKPKIPKPTTLFNPFQNGLQLRDKDLVDFLNERLGDHEETWAGKNVAAFLSREMIEELETCFQGLEPIAKLKIVLGFSQLSTKRLQDWKKEINTLLEIAAQDPDDWVEAISDHLRIFSPTGIIELEPTRNMEIYREALGRVYHKLLEYANREDSQYCHVPEVYHFCDEEVIENELNYIPREPEVHFTIKKKLKADIMREECLNELKLPKPCKDETTGLTSTLPMKFRSSLRQPDMKTPMRGIVQPNAMKINGGFTSEPKKFPRQLAKRDGGALLISIDDIPHAHLKRKKEQDKEEREKKKEQEQAEKKRLDAERRKAIIEKAEERKKEAARMREEAMRKKKEAEEARQARALPVAVPVKKQPSNDPMKAFADPSLQLERLRQTKMEDKDEPMDTEEPRPKGSGWMYNTEEISQIGDKDDDYEFLNRPRPAGLESRETIIQKTTTEVIESVSCCTLEQQRQIVAFMSGNKAIYRPMLGRTNLLKISDAIQQGIVDEGVCRVRVETFIHLDFDSGEWRKQQRCKVLDGDEIPPDFDGRQCTRLNHQQIFNEIARNLQDEPEDKKFAGESVIVQPNVELKLSEEKNKLISPNGSGPSDVVYGQEVTAGEMTTVLTGISGCIGMRTVVTNKSALLSPGMVPASTAATASKPPEVVAAVVISKPKATPVKKVKPRATVHPQPVAAAAAQPQPQTAQQQPMLIALDSTQLQQPNPNMPVRTYLMQQGLPQQQQQQQSLLPQQPQPLRTGMMVQLQRPQPQQLQQPVMLVQQQQQQQPQLQQLQQQPRFLVQQQWQQARPGPSATNIQQLQQISIPQFAQQSLVQSMNVSRQNPQSQINQQAFFSHQPFPQGTTPMIFVNGNNLPQFNVLPQTQIPNVSAHLPYQMSQNQMQNVTYQFQSMPNQNDEHQQYRY